MTPSKPVITGNTIIIAITGNTTITAITDDTVNTSITGSTGRHLKHLNH